MKSAAAHPPCRSCPTNLLVSADSSASGTSCNVPFDEISSSSIVYILVTIISLAQEMKADRKRKAALVHVVFQLTIFIIFMKAKATAEMVEGCIESQLTLSCNEMKVINISSVVLGDSSGCSGTNCCPKNYSCTAKPNDNHVNDVHRQCSGRQRCAVNVTKETIECTTLYGLLNTNQNNDFERIVYDCINNGKMVEGCIESQLTLSCDERKVINISSVVLGDSSGCLGTSCCPKHNSCTAKPSDTHVYDVHRRCNGRRWCTVNVLKEEIPCSYFYGLANNDFERIVYDCIDNEKMVEGCAFSKMTLTCNETKVISISSVVLGDSPGCPDANCCPKNNDCTAKPNDNHVNEVHRRCNGRLTCTVDVIRERIPCESTLFVYHPNDFERITYICIDERSMPTNKQYTDEIEYTSVTETSISEDAMTSNEPEMLKGTEPMPIIIAIVCLLVLITVIVVIIVLIKRKRKKSQLNANSNPAKLSVLSHDVDDTAYEEIETIVDRTYEKFVPCGTEDLDNHTYMAIATSGDRTYEKFVPSGTEDVDKHTYAGLVTK